MNTPLNGRIRMHIPKPNPAAAPFAKVGFFRERKKNRRKSEEKNAQLVWDCIEDDMTSSHMELVPSTAAIIPAL